MKEILFARKISQYTGDVSEAPRSMEARGRIIVILRVAKGGYRVIVGRCELKVVYARNGIWLELSHLDAHWRLRWRRG